MSWSQAQSSRKASKGRNIKKIINLILIFKKSSSLLKRHCQKKMKRLVTVWEKHLQKSYPSKTFVQNI